MTDSWKTNKEMKRDDLGDRLSRFFVLGRDHKIIMKKFALMVLVIGLVGVFSGIASGQTLQNGIDAYRDKDFKKAFNIMKPLAEQGNTDAQVNLGVMYVNGQGVTQDFKEAEKWYRLAAEKGDFRAQTNLGEMYSKGQGVMQDFKEALKWYRLAAEQGDANAQYNVGFMYYLGKGVNKDTSAGLKWLHLATEQGHEKALRVISKMQSAKEAFKND